MTVIEAYYYQDGNEAEEPIAVSSPSELDRILDYVLTHEQAHPPVFVVRGRPTQGRLGLPDHQVKVDVDAQGGVGAILAMGPADFVADSEAEPRRAGVWVSRAANGPTAARPLYIDKATLTPFPSDAGVPIDQWRKALHQLLETGKRPTCVQWQESDVF